MEWKDDVDSCYLDLQTIVSLHTHRELSRSEPQQSIDIVSTVTKVQGCLLYDHATRDS